MVDLHKILSDFFSQAVDIYNIRYLLYYAVGNFALLILYSLYEQSVSQVDLSLKPATTTLLQGNWLLWSLAVLTLPLELFFEELGFRVLPKIVLKDWLHLDKHSSHWIPIFIVVSGVWAGLIHQLNVSESSVVGSLIYFGIQLFSGLCFAWIYVHKGLGASWAVHVSWDLFIVFLAVVALAKI